MAGSVTDIIDRVSDSTTGRPVVSALAAPKALGAVSIQVTDATNWTTTTGIHFIIYQVTAAGVKDPTSQTEWKGTLAGTTVSNLVLTGGIDRAYNQGDIVELAPTARWAKDFYDWGAAHANQDGTLKTTAVQAALNQTGTAPAGWTTLGTVPTLAATNGNRSFNIQYASVDYTDRLSKSMRLLLPRTGSTPTQSASFNGSSQWANKASSTGITFTTTWAAEAWVFLNPGAYNGTVGSGIIHRRTGTSDGWSFGINASGQLECLSVRLASNSRNITSSVAVPVGHWVHVACSVDLGAGTGALYIDGVPVPIVNTLTGTAATLTQNATTPLSIGTINSTNIFPFNGQMTDVRLWSTTRTNQQILDNMNQQLTGSETGLNGYWKFNGDLNDSTTNANNLTATGSMTATFVANPFYTNAYAIITSAPVYSGGNTTMTVQTPEGYPIPNQTLGTSSYGIGRPFGFPAEPGRWSVEVIDVSTPSKTSPALNVWYGGAALNQTGPQIIVPIGAWKIGYQAALQTSSTVTTQTNLSVSSSLSTSTSAETDPTTTAQFRISVTSTAQMRSTVYRDTYVALTTATTYYIILKTLDGSNVNDVTMQSTQAPTRLRAECAYL